MKKLLGLSLSLLCSVATPAFATEYHPDPGMNTPASAMLDPASPNLWTISGGKAHGNGAKVMQMLMWSAPGVKAGHKYNVTYTVSNYVSGTVEATLGETMTGASTGSYITASGFTPINDNFTTSVGLTTAGVASPNPTSEVGSYRMMCALSSIAPNDSMVYHGQPGRSHLHTAWGNTQTLNPNATYAHLRANGGTSCGDATSPNTPIWRQAYWMPSMLDGAGNVVVPMVINQYYKEDPAAGGRCTNPADPLYVPGAGGACVNTPLGMRYISGYNQTTNSGSPSVVGSGHWECWGAGTYGVPTPDLKNLFHGGCAKKGEGGNAPNQGGQIGFFFIMANCWDGTYLDTPNHRDHVVYATRNNGSFFGGCPDDHPYRILSPQPQVFFEIDDNFVAGKWHLSSDEMVAGITSTNPGYTMHEDVIFTVSPTVWATLYTNCISNGASCGGGTLGDGTALKDGDILRSTGSPGDPDTLASSANPRPKGRYYSTALAGIGRPARGNGTYTQVITAVADGRISLTAIEDFSGNGFVGDVDDFSVSDAGN